MLDLRLETLPELSSQGEHRLEVVVENSPSKSQRTRMLEGAVVGATEGTMRRKRLCERKRRTSDRRVGSRECRDEGLLAPSFVGGVLAALHFVNEQRLLRESLRSIGIL